MPSASADWCRTLGNYTPPRSLRVSAGFAPGIPRESVMNAKLPRLPDPRLPDPQLPNPNVLLLQRQRQQVVPLPPKDDAAKPATARDETLGVR